MPGVVDERTAVAIVNFDFSKAFKIVSCKMLTEKTMKDQLNKQAVKTAQRARHRRQWPVVHSLLTCGCTPGIKTGSGPV